MLTRLVARLRQGGFAKRINEERDAELKQLFLYQVFNLPIDTLDGSKRSRVSARREDIVQV